MDKDIKNMNTRHIITQTAIELFKKDGYDAITIPIICKEAKVSRGTFYYHFQSKDEIIYEYIENFLAGISDIMPELLRLTSAKEQLWRLYRYACEQTISMGPEVLKAFYRIDMSSGLKQLSPSSETPYLYQSKSFKRMVIGLIEKAQAQKEIHTLNSAEELELAFNTIIVGTGIDWSCKKGKYDEIERLKMLFEIIFHR